MKLLKSKAGMAGKLITIVVNCVLAGALIPTAVVSITGANGNFTGAALALWIILPVIIIIALVLIFLKVAGISMK
jgi:hypothetical protein